MHPAGLVLNFDQSFHEYKCGEVSIIEKLPLEKNHIYLINFLITGQVSNNFVHTVITTYDFRLNSCNKLLTSCCVIITF